MIILELVIDYWLFGKDKDITISQLVIGLIIILIMFKILISLKILKEFGHTFITLIVLIKIRLLHLLSTEKENYKV